MAIDVDDGALRPEPGLGLALVAVITIVVITAVLALLIYVLMQGVAATSSGKPGSAPVAPPPLTSPQATSGPIAPPAAVPITPPAPAQPSSK